MAMLLVPLVAAGSLRGWFTADHGHLMLVLYFTEEGRLGRMKKMMAVMAFLMMMPAVVWAKEPSNAELYQMIKAMEQKFNEALDQTNQALAEAQKAKQEAAIAKQEAASAREEAARAKAELAQLKAAAEATPAPVAAPAEPLIRKAETVPGLGASFEVVYMRPSRSALDYAIIDTNTDTDPQGSYDSIHPDYSAGLRYGLAYTFETGTDLHAQYMTLDTHDSASAEAPPGGRLWGTWTHPDMGSTFDSAEARYDLDYDVFDLGLGKKFTVGDDLGLRVDAGLRYARIDQNLNIAYLQGATIFNVEDTNTFTGWGPRLGLGADWQMGHGFNLFGSAAGSLLLGDFDLALLTASGTTEYGRIKDTVDNRVVPVVEMRAGIGYAYKLANGMYVGAKAGYEWQNWFNMVMAQRFADDIADQIVTTDTTDLSLDGFFLEGFINF